MAYPPLNYKDHVDIGSKGNVVYKLIEESNTDLVIIGAHNQTHIERLLFWKYG